MSTSSMKERLQNILTPARLIAVYNLKFPYTKQQRLSGSEVGQFHFQPSAQYVQSFYDTIFHTALVPISQIPLQDLLDVDLTQLLPDADANDFPEQCLGLITLIDQARILCGEAYGRRYTRSFFDPISEKLSRQLIAMPVDLRPDGKTAWLSRGYSFEDWLVRTVWFWGPPVHSDVFMTVNRQSVKDWLHHMRSEVEEFYGIVDPFKASESGDDVDLHAFPNILGEGPPKRSYADQEHDATISDYSFWWIRILNSHFAITDFCGHYPFWVRWKGEELSEKDIEYFEKTDNFMYNPEDEACWDEIRDDYLKGTWKPLPPNEDFETSVPPGGHGPRRKMLGERGHGPVMSAKFQS